MQQRCIFSVPFVFPQSCIFSSLKACESYCSKYVDFLHAVHLAHSCIFLSLKAFVRPYSSMSTSLMLYLCGNFLANDVLSQRVRVGEAISWCGASRAAEQQNFFIAFLVRSVLPGIFFLRTTACRGRAGDTFVGAIPRCMCWHPDERFGTAGGRTSALEQALVRRQKRFGTKRWPRIFGGSATAEPPVEPPARLDCLLSQPTKRCFAAVSPEFVSC